MGGAGRAGCGWREDAADFSKENGFLEKRRALGGRGIFFGNAERVGAVGEDFEGVGEFLGDYRGGGGRFF
jgi:hypothetical protein